MVGDLLNLPSQTEYLGLLQALSEIPDDDQMLVLHAQCSLLGIHPHTCDVSSINAFH